MRPLIMAPPHSFRGGGPPDDADRGPATGTRWGLQATVGRTAELPWIGSGKSRTARSAMMDEPLGPRAG